MGKIAAAWVAFCVVWAVLWREEVEAGKEYSKGWKKVEKYCKKVLTSGGRCDIIIGLSERQRKSKQ